MVSQARTLRGPEEWKASLQWVCNHGYTRHLRTMLKRDTFEKHSLKIAITPDGSTPLHLAATRGYLEIVKLLAEAGADIAATNACGQTPLHKCAEHGHDDVMAYLLNKEGVDAGALAKDGSSPLILASSNGHLACVDHLLNTDCDLDAATLIREDHGGCTAILLASQNGHASVVKSLLMVVRILISLIKGYTSLISAAEEGHGTVVDVLLAADIDVNAQNSSGKSALFCACEKRRRGVVKILLEEESVIVNLPTKMNKIPLHCSRAGL